MFCSRCGTETARRVPEGEDRERDVCVACGEIHYSNPKVIVGCLPEHEGKVLLCLRAIEPRKDYWTLPAGFMENGETTAEGAAREMLEEAAAVATDMALYHVFDVPRISQVYVFYRCAIERGEFGVGPESLESQLFAFDDIPWDQLAFPVVKQLLKRFIKDYKSSNFPIEQSVITWEKR